MIDRMVLHLVFCHLLENGEVLWMTPTGIEKYKFPGRLIKGSDEVGC